jgi:hypothetical protein
VAYYRGADERTVGELLGVAGQLHDLGARQDEAQATRFAAWASARHGQPAHYAVLAQRASAILDEIAGELAPGPRTLYLMNKWNGRDEFVAGRMERLLSDGRGAPRQPRRSEILEVFHEIDTLTHWPIDDAFGDRDAARLAGATSDMVLGWLAERTALPARAGGGRDFSLRSTLSLWWFPARTMVLHYHVLPDRTYLFRIARRHLDVVVLPVGRVHLTSDMRAAADDPAQLEMLANRLGIAGTLDRFPGIRRLVIVPHDVIAGVPFAALPCRDGSLCDRVSLVQLDRLSRWRRPRRRTHGRFVTVGINSYAGSGYRDLGQPEHEATEVVAAFERADAASYLLGEAATCEAIRAALPDATNLHVAAHGVFDPVHPGDSGIVLRERGGFRTLTLHELRRIELRRIELATLATCRSAESAVLPGRERICLPSALLDAGVRGVIASLWSVEDEPSVAIMTALYRRLRTEPPAVALARVQAAARAAGEPPANWAGLVFYGNE